jgi:hypothetical protein
VKCLPVRSPVLPLSSLTTVLTFPSRRYGPRSGRCTKDPRVYGDVKRNEARFFVDLFRSPFPSFIIARLPQPPVPHCPPDALLHPIPLRAAPPSPSTANKHDERENEKLSRLFLFFRCSPPPPPQATRIFFDCYVTLVVPLERLEVSTCAFCQRPRSRSRSTSSPCSAYHTHTVSLLLSYALLLTSYTSLTPSRLPLTLSHPLLTSPTSPPLSHFQLTQHKHGCRYRVLRVVQDHHRWRQGCYHRLLGDLVRFPLSSSSLRCIADLYLSSLTGADPGELSFRPCAPVEVEEQPH